MSDSEHLLNTLRNFCDAYPESIFPTPPEDQRAKDAAVADVMREMALPWFKRAADRIDELELELHLARGRIEALKAENGQLRKGSYTTPRGKGPDFDHYTPWQQIMLDDMHELEVTNKARADCIEELEAALRKAGELVLWDDDDPCGKAYDVIERALEALDE